MKNELSNLSRRSFIKLCTALGVIASFPVLAAGKLRKRWRWDSFAMGMDINIQICHEDKKHAQDLARLCFDEVSRLEAVFTLYSNDSELARLNKDGFLDYPSPEMVELMSLARRYGDLTNGNFDMSLQPVWQVIKKEGADSPLLKEAFKLVDYRKVAISPQRISFEKKGMAVSLNGIAQGYITDKITGLLKLKGIDSALVNIGEIRAIGNNEHDKPWKIGLKDPKGRSDYFKEILLSDKAISTTGGYGLRLGKSGNKHHIFNPKSGKSEDRYLSLSVVADTAIKADALSTAFYSMRIEEIRAIAQSLKDISVIVMHNNGQVQMI